MVELRTRTIEMRGGGGNCPEEWGLKRISCASQLTIADTAGTSPNPACNNTYKRSPKPNQTCHTPDFSYPLISSISVSSLSPISLFLVHHSIIIAEHKVKLSLSISPCDDPELALNTAYAKYKQTLSTAYTEYSIHQSTAYTKVQHTPKYSIHQSTAYTKVQHIPKYSIHARLIVFHSLY